LSFPKRILTGEGKLSDYRWDFYGLAIVGAFAVVIVGVVIAFGMGGGG